MKLLVALAQIASAVATVVIAVLTFMQSRANARQLSLTERQLKEAEKSRRGSVAPRLEAEWVRLVDLGGLNDLGDGAFTGDYGLRVRAETKVDFSSDSIKHYDCLQIRLKNAGRGPALGVTLEHFDQGTLGSFVIEPAITVQPESEGQTLDVLIEKGSCRPQLPWFLVIRYVNIYEEKMTQCALIEGGSGPGQLKISISPPETN